MKDPVRTRTFLGRAHRTGKRGEPWLKTAAALAAFAATTAAAVPAAHAQYGGGGEALVAILIAGGVVEGGTAIGGLVSAIGSSVQVANGNVHRRWFVSSYVFGGLNLAAAILWGSLAESSGNPTFSGITVGHASLAAWGLAMPTVGFARGQQEPQARWSPVVIGGRDVGGRRWNGVGVQIVGF